MDKSPDNRAAAANRLMSPDLYAYYSTIAWRESPHEAALRLATQALPEAHYQLAPEEGQLLRFLIELLGAKRFLEIGTFTGYSALNAALAMGPDGHVDTLDVEPRFVDVGRPHWQAAEVAERIDVHIGPALASLENLAHSIPYDLALIDADKEAYGAYYERCLTLVRPGGVIAIDNTLWRGRVANPEDRREKTRTMRDLNAAIHADERVTPVIIPMGDGLTLARVR